MTKAELRTLYKQQRMAFDSKEKMKLDDLLLIQFQQFDFSFVQQLVSYFPSSKFNEPNTFLFTNYLRHFAQLYSIGYPKINTEDNTMQAILIDEETVYTPNSLNIKEPNGNEILNPLDIDLIFIPLLAFDQQGYRVGFGKGYYDKFLATCSDNTLKMGFSYFPPVEKIENIDIFDIAMDICITPEKIYEF